jgi:hypothetical protein
LCASHTLSPSFYTYSTYFRFIDSALTELSQGARQFQLPDFIYALSALRSASVDEIQMRRPGARTVSSAVDRSRSEIPEGIAP